MSARSRPVEVGGAQTDEPKDVGEGGDGENQPVERYREWKAVSEYAVYLL